MEPFKNIYNQKSIALIADSIEKYDSSFNKAKFKSQACKDLEKLELKERVDHIAEALGKHLPYNYKKNIDLLIKTLAPVSDHIDHEWQGEHDNISGFIIWPYCTYVEKFGLEDFETSCKAMLEFTQRFSAEFVIRHFILRHESEMFKKLKDWKKHPNHHVRRLVSEGSRPTLPWGISVPSLKTKLKRNINLIKSLRTDPSLYVRRSVANHLNDISRIDPELFFSTVEAFGQSPEEKYVIRHSSRTMLKKAHPKALVLHGYGKLLNPKINLVLKKKEIKEGESLPISVDIILKKPSNILVEYVIHYLKANGSYSEKVFRLRDLKNIKEIKIEKEVSFKKVTTRKHYAGIHYLQVQINGVRSPKKKFELNL